MTKAANFIDRTLEFAIAPSFTRIGPMLRRRLDHWTPLTDYDLSDRTVVLTGATSGIGFATATALLSMNATVDIIGRDPARTNAAGERLKSHSNGRGTIHSTIADVGDLDALRGAAEHILQRHGSIDVLIHNAGTLAAKYQATSQGIEATVASQVVGPFLLTHLLHPALKRATPGRVLWVSSGGMYTQPLATANLEMTEGNYDGTTAYARAKRAQVTINEMLAARLATDDIRVHAMHPGWADTPGVRDALPTFRKLMRPLLRDSEAAADTLVWLAADDGEPLSRSGAFWLDRRPRPLHRLASTRRSDTPNERAELWAWCSRQSGLTDLDPFPR